MRLLHINCNYIGTTLHQLMVQKLDELGFENQVFVPTYDKNLAVIKPNKNVCVCECFKKWDRLFFDYKQKKIQTAFQKNISVKDYDLIHAYTLFTDGNTARKMSEKYGVPYVVAVRNTDVNDFFRLMPHLRMRGVKTMLKARAVFFLSKSYRLQVFDRYVPKKYHEQLLKKTYIIPNGIDDFWFENLYTEKKECDKNSVNIIYAGRIDSNKNILSTQKALEVLAQKGINTNFTVVGKIEDKNLFERIMLDKRTTHIPAVPKEKLIELYRKNHIFVMPSFTESFGLVYAEAISQGLPVVYTKGQGFDNQFACGEVGYAVDPGSTQEIAEAIEKIIQNYQDITKNLAQKSTRYNWDSICNKYLEIYKKI